MSRGDQRERDRAKSQAKLAQKQRQQSNGGDPASRNLSDKTALQAKIKAKQALKAEQALLEESDVAKPKPKPKKKAADASLDDLLSAGLSGPGAKKRGARK